MKSARWLARLARIWSALRALSGDDAYERYCRHRAAAHPGAPLLSRRAFCAEAEGAKWNGVTRCC